MRRKLAVVTQFSVKDMRDALYTCSSNLMNARLHHIAATICAGLLRYADIQPGDVVLDPMCGGGSIPIEGSFSDPKAFHFGGEIHNLAVERCAGNAKAVPRQATGGKNILIMFALIRDSLYDFSP